MSAAPTTSMAARPGEPAVPPAMKIERVTRHQLLIDQQAVLQGLMSGGSLDTTTMARLTGYVARTCRKWAAGEQMMPFDAIVRLAVGHGSPHVRDALHDGLLLAHSGRLTIDPDVGTNGSVSAVMREVADVVDAHDAALRNDGMIDEADAEFVCSELDQLIRVAYATRCAVVAEGRRVSAAASAKKPARPTDWMKRLERETAERQKGTAG